MSENILSMKHFRMTVSEAYFLNCPIPSPILFFYVFPDGVDPFGDEIDDPVLRKSHLYLYDYQMYETEFFVKSYNKEYVRIEYYC